MLLRPSKTSVTQVRVRLKIPAHYQNSPLISKLILNYGLIVNITGATLGEGNDGYGLFDLELKGPVDQIGQGLTFLASLGVTITGKANPTGDSWHC